ncbi:MAG: VOC family protein [Candidatus Eremiobacteraeota bacterium]|nr:VOC family protein [Candidatus Eremiobacteraeota bacterium]
MCRDRERSRAFYQSLGFRLKEPKSRSFVLESGPGVELHLHEQLTEKEESLYGVEWARGSRGMVQSYEVDSLDSLVSTVPSDNLIRGPLTTPWGTRLIMVSDPDGHLLEFRERTRQG